MSVLVTDRGFGEDDWTGEIHPFDIFWSGQDLPEEDLAVEFTYEGLAWAPTNAGIYAVTGTIVDAHWEGWTNGMLVVAPSLIVTPVPARLTCST